MTTREHLRWLAAYWKPNLHWLFVLFLLTLISSAVAIAYPLVIKVILDDLAEKVDPGKARLFNWLGILGLIALGRLLAGLYPGFRAWVNLRIEKAIRERLFGSILEKDYTFYGKHRTGDLVTRLTDDIAEYPRIAWFACSGVFRFIDSFSKFLFCVAAMLWLDAQLALLAMAPVPIMLYVFYLARVRLRDTYQKQQEAVSKTNSMIESAFAGVKIVKAFNADGGQKRRLGEILRERIGIQFRLARLVVLVHEMDHIVGRLGQVIVISLGGFAVLEGELTLGTLYGIYLYLDMLIHPMMDLPNLFVTARQAFVSIDRVDEVLTHPVVVERKRDGAVPGRIGKIEMEDAGFSYRDDVAPALSEISFEVEPGSRVAVVGPVASGKTTLLRMLAGLVPAQQGRLSLNGRRFEEWDWPSLRQKVGYVPQESLLFSETVEENVAFDREADDAWVRRCLEVAQMAPDLEQMEKGTKTLLGRQGTLVSGGQKQRIAIARALAGRPDLLLLDDCTASLDAHNEDAFWAGLETAFPSATIFVVSHRLATILRADTILVLDRGKLIDQGTHDELAGRCEVYKAFLLTEERKSHLA
jgi:ATP-binding cassette subfamily B protein